MFVNHRDNFTAAREHLTLQEITLLNLTCELRKLEGGS
jgi:hypothetical protein